MNFFPPRPLGDSDIDVFIAGTSDGRAVKMLETLSHIEINPIVYPSPPFASQGGFEPRIAEVKKNHIIWKYAESFVRHVLK